MLSNECASSQQPVTEMATEHLHTGGGCSGKGAFRQPAYPSETLAYTPSPRRVKKRGLYPNPSLTPGSIFSNFSAETVGSDFAKKRRKWAPFLRQRVLKRYRINPKDWKCYGIDHFIPLSLGGSNQIENLWPQPNDEWLLRKQVVERHLCQSVVSGNMTLNEAQRAIVEDWVAVYHELVDKKRATRKPSQKQVRHRKTKQPNTRRRASQGKHRRQAAGKR